MVADPGGDAEPLTVLAREVERLADRLRTMSDVRLRQPLTPEATRASAVLDLAQALAEAAQGFEERAAALPPVWRVLPDAGVLALGDQVAVTGHDVVAAAAEVGPGEPVWSRAGRRSRDDVLSGLVGAVRALRQAL